MTVTVDDLARHLGFATTPADTEALDRALGTARAVIWPYLLPDASVMGTRVTWDGTPVSVTDVGGLTLTTDQEYALDLAVLTVAQDLWRRKDSAGGSFVFADGSDLTGILPRDQLNSVWPLLVESGLVPIAVVA